MHSFKIDDKKAFSLTKFLMKQTMMDDKMDDKAGIEVDQQEQISSTDNKHVDEAISVLRSYSGEKAWDECEERRLRRKIDYRLLPILCATYGLQVRLLFRQLFNIQSTP